jgi:hypothetical protein
METLHLEIRIDAPAARVYETMLAQDTYREWTAAFNPTSRYQGSWDKGSKILFLADGEGGRVEGMVSRIRENIPHKYLSIEHLGILKEGVEILSGPEVEAWAGCLEQYSFSEAGGTTLLKVSLDTLPEYRDYFNNTYPRALDKLKAICEARG